MPDPTPGALPGSQPIDGAALMSQALRACQDAGVTGSDRIAAMRDAALGTYLIVQSRLQSDAANNAGWLERCKLSDANAANVYQDAAGAIGTMGGATGASRVNASGAAGDSEILAAGGGAVVAALGQMTNMLNAMAVTLAALAQQLQLPKPVVTQSTGTTGTA